MFRVVGIAIATLLLVSGSGPIGPDFKGPVNYLVVPRDAFSEGSYGRRGDGGERPQSASACRPEVAGACF